MGGSAAHFTPAATQKFFKIFETTLSGGAWKKSIENGVVLVRIQAKSWSKQVLSLASSTISFTISVIHGSLLLSLAGTKQRPAL